MRKNILHDLKKLFFYKSFFFFFFFFESCSPSIFLRFYEWSNTSKKSTAHSFIQNATLINFLKNNSKSILKYFINKFFFLIPQAKVAHSLPTVLTKVPLFAEGMRKNSIRDSGVNKECLKQQVYHPRLRLGR